MYYMPLKPICQLYFICFIKDKKTKKSMVIHNIMLYHGFLIINYAIYRRFITVLFRISDNTGNLLLWNNRNIDRFACYSEYIFRHQSWSDVRVLSLHFPLWQFVDRSRDPAHRLCYNRWYGHKSVCSI